VPDHRQRLAIDGGADWNAAAARTSSSITSGKPRKPGMSRDDLVRDNFEIMKERLRPNLVQYTPNAIVVPVANPLDAMSQALYRPDEVPARAHHRHGRRARLRAHEHLRGDGAQGLGGERALVSCSAATATRWCRCRAIERGGIRCGT
jgi:hypothetical protein